MLGRYLEPLKTNMNMKKMVIKMVTLRKVRLLLKLTSHISAIKKEETTLNKRIKSIVKKIERLLIFILEKIHITLKFLKTKVLIKDHSFLSLI